MENIILFDDPIIRIDLLPFTFTRPVAHIRCGITTLYEKWETALPGNYSVLTAGYLSGKFPPAVASGGLYVNGALCPETALLEAVRRLETGEVLLTPDGTALALRSAGQWEPDQGVDGFAAVVFQEEVTLLRKKWDITRLNGAQIGADFRQLTHGRVSEPVADPFTHCYRPDQVFIEKGAVLRAAILNAESGPIYIGKNAVVQEGSTIQGPFALGEGAILSQGAKIRPGTTIGPFCKVGGEVSSSVFFARSNKGHDGYLGNSVIGEWCNLGANTNNSNLKNDYKTVKLFSHATRELEDTGQVFCGLFMGDYSKSGINTMFITGTVTGVHVNVFGAGFQEKFIPSFSWGGKAEGICTYRLDKALSVARETMNHKGVTFAASDEALLREVFEETAVFRFQELGDR